MPHTKTTHVRYLIVLMLFIASTFSYGDRVVLSIAGVAITRDLHLDALRMGYLFSGFSWAYVVAQLPAGGLLDRFGSKHVYGVSIVCWSICALLAGFTGYLPAVAVLYTLFALRLLSGLAQAPVFPGNGRIVAAWFPAAERGRASAVFNSSQYFAIACNYVCTQTAVMLFMSLAFFGKGFGAYQLTVISDTSPKGLIGLNGGLFNLIGNMAGVTTPIIIGYIVKRTGSFQDALIFVGATALLAIIAYLPIVGEIRRVEMNPALIQGTGV